jgi:hypothetical protein
MLNNDILNTLVLAAMLAAIVGSGVYVTQKQQPAELERLEQQQTALRLKQAEVIELLTEQAESRAKAEDAVRRWNSRYKVLPTVLTSPAVVAYLNQLTGSGFRSFDISLGGVVRRGDYSTLAYDLRGVATFEALYGFIWEVENGRGLYRINNLVVREVAEDERNRVTNVPRRLQLVQFSMTIEAYFGGAEGMSAPDSIVTVPDWVLPTRHAARDPFYPLILEALPPNSDDLVDVELDELVSVVGNAAVFRRSGSMRTVRQGERVYLGYLAEVDAKRARVAVELNKGGIRERLDLDLATGERYRMAMGGIQIIPLTAERPQRSSPPQPGTPEYRRLYGAGPLAGTSTTSDPDLSDGIGSEDAEPPQRAEPVVTQPSRGVAVRPFPGARPADDPR